MVDIPNTEYITVKRDKNGQVGIFVGGKPATTYRGEEIYEADYVKDVFACMQKQNPEIEEFHIGAFETRGEYAKPGNPDGVFGPNAWCRVKYKNGDVGPWVFVNDCGSAANCAGRCVFLCASSIRESASFRAALCGPIEKSNANLAMTQNALTNALKDTDLSKFIGAHTIGSYEIIVRNKQNTRG